PQDRVEEPNGVRPEETEPQPPKSPQSPDSQPPAEHVPPPAEHPQPAEKQPPVNSKGEPYPTVIDPRTFQPIPFPDDLVKTEPENRVDWGSEQRGNFIKEWIEQGYPDYGKEGWKMFDIHHIKPREWGGTNDFWNLVPIDRFWHNRVVTPWWDAYKP
ncbi:MAG TPA: HNH endonuclease signature motif containing protein, partial [Ktedonobacteraceae bacterium]|nr:HNH endonuclease signature motif containing protein [Ktedonobacteraceae bacterium]